MDQKTGRLEGSTRRRKSLSQKLKTAYGITRYGGNAESGESSEANTRMLQKLRSPVRQVVQRGGRERKEKLDKWRRRRTGLRHASEKQ